MGRSSGLFFGRSSVSREDGDNDIAEKAFAWDSLSMSKKKRCLPGARRKSFRVSNKRAKPLLEWMVLVSKEHAYHLESDVNSGWKAVARMFLCRTATITRSFEYTSSWQYISGQLTEDKQASFRIRNKYIFGFFPSKEKLRQNPKGMIR